MNRFFPFRKLKTSDFFEGKFRCFASKVRRFYAKKSDVSVLPAPSSTPPLKKSFLKISYISYTSTHNIQHLLALSGVGLGVG